MTTPSIRLSAAKRIKRLYLTPTSNFAVEWPTDIVDPTIPEVLEKLSMDSDSNDMSQFDDIGVIVMQTLEKAYFGTFNTPMVGSATNLSKSIDYQAYDFHNSVFRQAMRNDLHGTANLTSDQYKRTIERMTDMFSVLNVELNKLECILVMVEDVSLDLEASLARHSPRKRHISHNPSSSRLEEVSASTVGRGTVRSANQHSMVWGNTEGANHTFLPALTSEAAHCEFCFLPAKAGPDERPRATPQRSFTDGDHKQLSDDNGLYRCETCGFYSHKTCRNSVRISCIKTSIEGEMHIGVEHGSEKTRLVEEKLAALQKEVDIEMKIHEGLEKITKAKYEKRVGWQNKKTAAEKDIAFQLEKNNKRLEVLKHEMQKRMVQLQSMQVVATVPLKDTPEVQTNVGMSNRVTGSGSVQNLNDPDLMDTGLIRVLVVDTVTKTESKKAIYISQNKSTIEVIEIILNKSNLPGLPIEFQLSYISPENGQLKSDEDRPMQIENFDYAETMFRLKRLMETKPISRDDPLLKKQMEILTEIIDSEQKYLEDLKYIQTIFYEPMESAGVLEGDEVNEIFHNLTDIIKIHERISLTLIQTGKNKVSKLIACFLEILPDFTCYKKYCGNQHQQRNALKKKQKQTNFLKLLQKCETNPKLHKLTFADMLMKPMQKITRYPLLFKRLLPNLVTDSLDYIDLSTLLTKIEQIIGDINEHVRIMESRFKIRLIEETTDFGLVTDRFSICTEERELMMENSFQYISKTGLNVEVVVLLFNDMILILKRSKKVEGGYSLFKLPIPLESAVFVDKMDTEDTKKVFQIVHIQQEVHNLQCYSVFDKKSWLQEAEAARSLFSSLYYDMELAYIRVQAPKYKSLASPKNVDSVYTSESDTSSNQSTLLHYFKNRKNGETAESPEEIAFNNRMSRKTPTSPMPSEHRIELNFTDEDLLKARNRLNAQPRPSLLQLSSSFIAGSRSNIQAAKLEKKNSNNNLMEKFKKTFKGRTSLDEA
ncbi:hypothetical protein BC833DRAFT_620385 [Globomyces pollinis-pini]|nr:hypothetical protein BC833DRAFT_620385 [Globomyces pollinis-pini]